jgi:hypothetical protein
MVPHLGAGAGSGIDVSLLLFHPDYARQRLGINLSSQDAYILAALLTHPSVPVLPSAKDISNIVDVYNTIRVPRGVGMSKASINQGHLYYFNGKEFDNYQEGGTVPWDLLFKTGLGIQNNWSWTSDDPRVERRKAEALLEKTLNTGPMLSEKGVTVYLKALRNLSPGCVVFYLCGIFLLWIFWFTGAFHLSTPQTWIYAQSSH